jgi:hypothetical protein
MDTEETATIVRLVKSVFPQQPIDRATYETWHLVIGHLDYTVAQAAVIAIAHSEKFCAAADIIAEAERARKRNSHPYDRTYAEAVEASTMRALGAATTEPTPEYIAAKDQMDAKFRERAQQVMFTDRQAGRRAQLWLDYKLSGKLPPALPLPGEPLPQWQPLPGDPPELRAWLARQSAEAGG